jgi:opacity protein-like surface antigen
MKIRNALLAASLGVLPAAGANAQYAGAPAGWEGIYIGTLGGYNILQDVDPDFKPTQVPPNRNISLDGGWGILGRIGYGFKLDTNWSVGIEFEGGYRYNSVDAVELRSITTPGSGENRTFAVMANAIVGYDFGGIAPYAGVGIGYAWNTAKVASTGVVGVDATKNHVALQGIVGLAVAIDAVPGLSANAEYRYFSLLEQSYPTTADFRAFYPTSTSVDVQTINHTFLIGLTYAFGVTPPPPPPPPAPAAAPAPTRTYLVFFDFDSAALTDRARQIIAEAAANAPRVQATRIEVTGHTDTVGSAAYNQALSIRRAEAVARELEARGIPRSQMVIRGVGFSQPLVPTGPNVREPQNRRVEIVLR